MRRPDRNQPAPDDSEISNQTGPPHRNRRCASGDEQGGASLKEWDPLPWFGGLARQRSHLAKLQPLAM
jgi:hypothetical protein